MRPLHLAQRKASDIGPLQPPITAEESRWWTSVRSDFRRRVMLRVGVPFFVVWLAVALISKPHKIFTLDSLWFIPAMTALTLGMAWLQFRALESAQRDQEVRLRRIRRSLEPSADDEPPSGHAEATAQDHARERG